MADTYTKKDNLHLRVTRAAQPAQDQIQDIEKAEIVSGLIHAYESLQAARAHWTERKKIAAEAVKKGIEFTEEELAKINEYKAKK